MVYHKFKLLLNKRLCLNLILFSFFMLWSFCQPILGDFYVEAKPDVLVNHNLFQTLTHLYQTVSGRMFYFALTTIMFSKSYALYTLPIFNIINAIFLVYWLHLLYRFIYGKEFKLNNFILVVAFYLIYEILVARSFGESFMWRMASIEYLWGGALFLTILLKFYNDITKPSHSWAIFAYFIYGLVFGQLNAIFIATTLAVFISAIITVYLYRLFALKLLFKLNHLSFLLGISIASYFDIIAPSNYLRQLREFTTEGINPASIHASFFTKIFWSYRTFFSLLHYDRLYPKHRYVFIISLMIILFVWLYKNKSYVSDKIIAYFVFIFILLNMQILSFFEVAYSNDYTGRLRTFIDLAIYIFLFKIISIICKNIKFKCVSSFILLVFILIYYSVCYLQLGMFSYLCDPIIFNQPIGSSCPIPENDKILHIFRLPIYVG